MAAPLLAHCPPGLPRDAYVPPGRHAHEVRAICAQEWICVGRLADLTPGTMRPLSLAGVPVIVARTPDGAVAAYHNTCRHRGAASCAAEGRLGKLITRPDHAWAYAAEYGRLPATGLATPTADLERIYHEFCIAASMVWSGFLIQSLNADQVPLFPDTGLHAQDNWPMDALITGHRITRDLACNWKVFWENYNECLHCPEIHPELVDMVPVGGRGIMSPEEAPDCRLAVPAGNPGATGVRCRQSGGLCPIVLDQDGRAAEMNQRGLRPPAYMNATLMAQEFGIARFHQWVRDRLQTMP